MTSASGLDLAAQRYISNPEIDITLKLALELNRPILVEGPAGTGKTSVAISIAQALDWKLFRIQCYEGITFENVIGEFDYKRQLLHIEFERQKQASAPSRNLEDIFSRKFFIERPLFLSFIENDPNVLLIDEIDKSDEEFEAFLLEALGERQITIPELGTFQASNEKQIVILTSNSSRDLSEPLRRRCLFLYIDFPTLARERRILAVHTGRNFDEPLIQSIAGIVHQIRQYDLRKVPSIAETIDWAKALILLGKEFIDEPTLKETITILLKYQEDINRIDHQLKEIIRLGTT
ncbi:MAG: MoxR family ATPase [Candidatus Heimdallarchaeota archaeon]|nr:MAG: MoxR family ATPase [Candidatus Heimdallarchaeota archaeon]